MKKILALALIACLLIPSISEAGVLRNLLGRGKAAAGKVLRKASHPFGGCANGSCR